MREITSGAFGYISGCSDLPFTPMTVTLCHKDAPATQHQDAPDLGQCLPGPKRGPLGNQALGPQSRSPTAGVCGAEPPPWGETLGRDPGKVALGSNLAFSSVLGPELPLRRLHEQDLLGRPRPRAIHVRLPVPPGRSCHSPAHRCPSSQSCSTSDPRSLNQPQPCFLVVNGTWPQSPKRCSQLYS